MPPAWRIETCDVGCHRCGAQLYAMLRVPPDLAGWPAGSLGEGTPRLVPLCPRCHADEPSVQGILAFFALHGQVTGDNAGEFGALVEQWLHRLPPAPTVDPDALERDVEAWRRGDYDDDPARD